MLPRIVALFILVSGAFAQQPLSLNEAVRRALANHPDLAAAGERVAEREGLRLQAGKTHNPTLNVQCVRSTALGGNRRPP